MNLNNISQIRYGGKDIVLGKLNGNIIYDKSIGPEQPEDSTESYYIEYTVDTSSSYALNGGTSLYMYGLPRIYTDNNNYEYPTSDMVEITLLDGSVTNDLNTTCNNVTKVKVMYPEDTISVSFHGSSSYKPLVKTIDYIKTDNFTDMSYMFYQCRSLTSLDLSSWDTSNVTNMYAMFSNCEKLTSLDLSNFNTSKVTSMGYMFYTCGKLTSLDVSNFDTSNVTNMNSMFQSCRSLTSLDLSSWVTNNVTNMSSMFAFTSLSSLDLSSWNTANVTNMNSMFYNASIYSLNLSNFDTNKVTNMGYMFSSVPKTVDWHYDGTNYANFTLTEKQTEFSGTFPWNQ